MHRTDGDDFTCFPEQIKPVFVADSQFFSLSFDLMLSSEVKSSLSMHEPKNIHVDWDDAQGVRHGIISGTRL